MQIPREPTNRQQFYMNKAAQLAYRSNMSHKHGCLIVNNDEILSSGYNHTYIHMYHRYSCHAEYEALRKIKKNTNLANAEMYIVRIGTNHLKLSKPCDACTKLIMKANIGKVYYSYGEQC